MDGKGVEPSGRGFRGLPPTAARPVNKKHRPQLQAEAGWLWLKWIVRTPSLALWFVPGGPTLFEVP